MKLVKNEGAKTCRRASPCSWWRPSIHFLSLEMNYTPEEIQSYLNALEEYYEGRNEKNK